jgi:hypothetical protein
MTIKVVTTLITGVLLAGSAAASLRATDASFASSKGCHSRTESGTSDEAPGFVVVHPVRPFAASAAAFKQQRAPHIIVLKPLTPSIQ